MSDPTRPAPSDTDVVIIGGGPVAMTAALLLARFGVESVMLEAKPERDPVGSKALCMQRDVLDILDRVEAGEQLVSEGVTWQRGRTYFRDHELFQITFHDPGRAHFPPFVNIGQDRTEFWLEQAVNRTPATEIRYGHQVTGIVNHESGVTVTAATAAGPVTVSGSYAIGADGAHSTTRKLLGIGFPGHSFDDQFLICDIRAELAFDNERRFFFDPEWNPDRQVLIHPQAGSVWRIDWQVPPDYDVDAERASGALDARIRKIIGEQDYEIVWMSVYRFHERLAERFTEARTFLAGDAAHLVAPFGARGLNSGIQDAENLAWKLAYVLHGWSPPELTRTYELERRPAAEENVRVTSETMEFLVPHTEAEWDYRRRVLEAAVHDPNVVPQVNSGKLAEPFWYLDSPLTTQPAQPVAFPTEPAVPRPVVPGVLCPDGPCRVEGRPEVTRLRQLFGAGLVVLSSGPLEWTPEPGLGPVQLYDLATIDLEGVLHKALEAPADTAVIVRPDGHIAARVPNRPQAVGQAAARAIGRFLTDGAGAGVASGTAHDRQAAE